MSTLKIYSLIALAILCQSLCAQDKAVVIPFKLTAYNNISVQAILNGMDTVNLMFHTAASSVTLTEEATRKIKSLKFNSSTDGIKSWGGADNSARLSENNILRIGDLEFNSVAIWENKYSGQETDGKFGIDLFKDKVIALDFDEKTLTISSDLPKRLRRYERLNLKFENDLMFVEANCTIDGAVIGNWFLIHSGYSGGLLFDDEFVKDHQIGKKLKITGEKELKDSYGNVLKTMKAILPGLTIGKEKLTDVPVGFFEGALGRQKMSIMGGDILKRFNVVIDAKRAFIYLKFNKFKKEKYAKT
jgi:hypothetical protein